MGILDLFNQGLDNAGEFIDDQYYGVPSRVVNSTLDTLGPVSASLRNATARVEEEEIPYLSKFLQFATGVNPGERTSYSRNELVDNARKITNLDPETTLDFASGTLDSALMLSGLGGLLGAGAKVGASALPKVLQLAKKPAVAIPSALFGLDYAKSKVQQSKNPKTQEALADTGEPEDLVDQSPKALLSRAIREQIQASIGDSSSNGVIVGRGDITGASPDKISVDKNADKSKGFSRSLPPIATYGSSRSSLTSATLPAYAKAVSDLGKRTDSIMSELSPEDIKGRFGTAKVSLEHKRAYARELAMQDLPPEFQQMLLSQQGQGQVGPQAEYRARKDLEKQAESAGKRQKEETGASYGTLAGMGALIAGAVYLSRRGKMREAARLAKAAGPKGTEALKAALASNAGVAETGFTLGKSGPLQGMPELKEILKETLKRDVKGSWAPQFGGLLPGPSYRIAAPASRLALPAPSAIQAAGPIALGPMTKALSSPSAAKLKEDALLQALGKTKGKLSPREMRQALLDITKKAPEKGGPRIKMTFDGGGKPTVDFDSSQTPLLSQKELMQRLLGLTD